MSIFEFRTGNTLAHTLDPRCKFALICLTGAGLASASLPACLALLFLMMPPLFRIGIGPFALVGQLKYFILFLCLIILVRGLAVPGPSLFSIFASPVSGSGLAEGGLVALRFFTVMVLGINFSATTRPSRTNRVIGFSHSTSFPACIAMIEITACQCGGVAITTTSSSFKSKSSS